MSRQISPQLRSLKGKCILTLRGSTIAGVDVIPTPGIMMVY